MNDLAVNLRYLLWHKGILLPHWTSHLADWAGCPPKRAEGLLKGASAIPDELAKISSAVGISEEELCYSDLLDHGGVDILAENLRHLTGSLDRGGLKRLAQELGVHPSTMSKWRGADQRPKRPTVAALCRIFGLPADTDLFKDPIFLLPTPISVVERRAWLKDRIEGLPPATLAELFPALQRLLSEQ